MFRAFTITGIHQKKCLVEMMGIVICFLINIFTCIVSIILMQGPILNDVFVPKLSLMLIFLLMGIINETLVESHDNR